MRCAVPFLFTPPIDMQHARGVCTLLWQRQAHLVGLHAPLRSHWAPLCLPLLSAFSEGHQMPFPFLPSYVAVLLPITQLRHSYALVRSLRWRQSALAHEVPGPSHAACVEGPGSSQREMEMRGKGFPSQNGLKAGADRAGPCHGEEATCEVDLARVPEAELAFTVINFASLLTLLPSPLFLPLPVLNRRHLSHRPSPSILPLLRTSIPFSAVLFVFP